MDEVESRIGFSLRLKNSGLILQFDMTLADAFSIQRKLNTTKKGAGFHLLLL
jgi:hypothetical protein